MKKKRGREKKSGCCGRERNSATSLLSHCEKVGLRALELKRRRANRESTSNRKGRKGPQNLGSGKASEPPCGAVDIRSTTKRRRTAFKERLKEENSRLVGGRMRVIKRKAQRKAHGRLGVREIFSKILRGSSGGTGQLVTEKSHSHGSWRVDTCCAGTKLIHKSANIGVKGGRN